MVDLHTAAKEGDTSTIIQAIGRGDDINARDKHQRTPLLLAAWAGQTDVVKLLLAKEGCNVNAGAMDDVNALHFAAQKGHTDIVRLLINAGLHVNSRTRKGVTALHFAAQYGHLETVKFLLARKANIQATTAKQQTAYQMAKHQEIKSVLDAAREEAAARLAAAAEDRPDTESRRQRNAQRKRAKQTRAEREEELEEVTEDMAGADLSAPTIGPAPPASTVRKPAGPVGDSSMEDDVDASVAGGAASAQAASDAVIGPAVRPADQQTRNGEAASAGATTQTAGVVGLQEGNDDGEEDVCEEEDEEDSEGDDDNSGARIGPVGPPVSYKRKAADEARQDASTNKVLKPMGASQASSKHAGKIVDARMVLSFMGDDEDEE